MGWAEPLRSAPHSCTYGPQVLEERCGRPLGRGSLIAFTPCSQGGDPRGLCPQGGLPGSSPLIPTAALGPTLRERRAAPRGLGPACSRLHHQCGRQVLARSGRSVSVHCMTSLWLQHPPAREKPPWNPGLVAPALTTAPPKGLGRVPVVIRSDRQGARLWRCGPACTTQAGSGAGGGTHPTAHGVNTAQPPTEGKGQRSLTVCRTIH